ncbi:hypothetical protein J437_LFUL010844 [Ladona fulva]|uniref:Uncharacterized protein n=1 Tax=Ladona fulva TaxID=123851 RepID=A0A8K0K9P3_LADFU|nr:hypothetical protein J437_LFUL010844 [Ladona fulva]
MALANAFRGQVLLSPTASFPTLLSPPLSVISLAPSSLIHESKVKATNGSLPSAYSRANAEMHIYTRRDSVGEADELERLARKVVKSCVPLGECLLRKASARLSGFPGEKRGKEVLRFPRLFVDDSEGYILAVFLSISFQQRPQTRLGIISFPIGIRPSSRISSGILIPCFEEPSAKSDHLLDLRIVPSFDGPTVRPVESQEVRAMYPNPFDRKHSTIRQVIDRILFPESRGAVKKVASSGMKTSVPTVGGNGWRGRNSPKGGRKISPGKLNGTFPVKLSVLRLLRNCSPGASLRCARSEVAGIDFAIHVAPIAHATY